MSLSLVPAADTTAVATSVLRCLRGAASSLEPLACGSHTPEIILVDAMPIEVQEALGWLTCGEYRRDPTAASLNFMLGMIRVRSQVAVQP